MNEPNVNYVEGRSCDGCTMCCKLLQIRALDKPRSKWCTHCDIGVGCKIYDERPSECRDFHCGFLINANFGEHWKPTNSKLVIALADDANQLTVFVDPDRPEAWRKEPFYSDIKNWARVAAKNNRRVVVSIGYEVIAVTPDGETSLGQVSDDQMIIERRKRGAGGTGVEQIVVNRSDPILEAMRILKDPEAAKNASPEQLAEAKHMVDSWLEQQDE